MTNEELISRLGKESRALKQERDAEKVSSDYWFHAFSELQKNASEPADDVGLAEDPRD